MTDQFPYPVLAMRPDKLVALTKSLMAVPVTYALGAKAWPITKQAGEFQEIDCSGFVTWAVFHGTAVSGFPVTWPDGSVQQHEYVDGHSYKKSDFESAKLDDGAIRIAFLTPEQGGGVGHVMLITGGYTCESHGHHGVDRRAWGSEPFMAECAVYVLTAPNDEE